MRGGICMGNKGDWGAENKAGKRKSGYEYLLAYKITVPIYDYTVAFCNHCQSPRYPGFPRLSSKRSFDQMVQAARSGMQNISEGNKQEGMKGYIKLSGVARGSLEELLQDYRAYARQYKLAIWPREKNIREIREIGEIWRVIKATPTLPDSPQLPQLPQSPLLAVNMMITLVNQASYLVDKLIASLKEKHMKEGGLTEELYWKRVNYRKNHP